MVMHKWVHLLNRGQDIPTKLSTKVPNELRYIRDVEHHIDINPMKTHIMGNPIALRNRKKRKHRHMEKLVVNEQLLLNSMLTKIKPNTFLSGRFKCEQCPRRTTMASFKKEKKKVILTLRQRLCKAEHLQIPAYKAEVWNCPSSQPGCCSCHLRSPRGKVWVRSWSADIHTGKTLAPFRKALSA